RGNKVTIRQVFYENIDGEPAADTSAYVEDIFYIDAATTTETAAQFTLTTKLNILDIQLPLRRFSRNRCWATYSGEGCWEEDGAGGWSQPTDFVTDDGYGIYVPGAGNEKTVGTTDTINVTVTPANCRGWEKSATHYLTFDIWMDDIGDIVADSHIIVSHDGGTSGWKFTDLTGLAAIDTPNAWNSVSIATNHANWADLNGGLTETSVNFFEVFSDETFTTLKIRNVRAKLPDDSAYFAAGGADDCNKDLV
ncbi:unnamed protein product, partial [marine sediment metagenome]